MLLARAASEPLLQLDDPHEGCFLCAPEPWRVICDTVHTRVLAGAGPLCPGYVIVAPKEHHGTAAELPSPLFEEFLAVSNTVGWALGREYGIGYTAYEHGRIGACFLKEARRDWSSYCHHAHRVFIPVATSVLPVLSRAFPTCDRLPTPQSLRAHAGKHYIYYETNSTSEAASASDVLHGRTELPSQFMRRVLTEALKTGRSWNWAVDHRAGEMLDTTKRLRPFFAGISCAFSNHVARPDSPHRLARTVSIDGLTCAGKTALATELSRTSGTPLVDTGLAFRYLAEASRGGAKRPAPCDIIGRLLRNDSPRHLRTDAITQAAARLGAEPEVRAFLHHEVFLALLQDNTPRIIVGRDAWRYRGALGVAVLLEASFKVRAVRRYLERAREAGELGSIDDSEAQLRAYDDLDMPKLPSRDMSRLLVVRNDAEPIAHVASEIIRRVSEVV